MQFYILAMLIILSGMARAENFLERARVTGFHCDYGKAAIELRSFDRDYVLYLAENNSGEPKYFEMREDQCNGIIKILNARLGGKIFELTFQVDRFSRVDKEFVPPTHPCRPGRRKCDDDGYYTEKKFEYHRLESFIDGYRFFKEWKVEP